MKRIVDVLVSVMAILVLLPLLVVIAIAVLVGDGWPILFGQPRAGFKGSIFRIWKFRTMADRTDAHGVLLPDEKRITRIGKFLRATSLDELPELINVIKGDMSLVGPRPLLVDYLPLYTAEQARRHDVKPGITGWAQVNGRNLLTWDDKFRLDTWYVDHRSLLLDLKILARSMAKVLQREGVSQAGHATMPAFEGSGSADDQTARPPR